MSFFVLKHTSCGAFHFPRHLIPVEKTLRDFLWRPGRTYLKKVVSSSAGAAFIPLHGEAPSNYRAQHQPLISPWVNRGITFLGVSTNGGNESENQMEQHIEPTWTYVPYTPPKQGQNRQRRRFSSAKELTVPKNIDVPQDKIEMSFARASGAGGQNVNKVNTKVEIRFHVMSAGWIPLEVRERIVQNFANRINKDGYIVVTSQEYRTQAQNKQDAIQKLKDVIMRAYPRPKKRKMRKGLSKASKEKNKADKKRRSATKANRKKVHF